MFLQLPCLHESPGVTQLQVYQNSWSGAHRTGNLCVLLWLLLLFVLFLTGESDKVKFENHWLRVLMRVSNKYLLIPTVLDLL